MPFKTLGYLFHCEPFSDFPSRSSSAKLFIWSSEQVIVPWHSIISATGFKNSPQSCLYLQHIFTLFFLFQPRSTLCSPQKPSLVSERINAPPPSTLWLVIFNIPIMAPNTLYWNFCLYTYLLNYTMGSFTTGTMFISSLSLELDIYSINVEWMD